MQQLSETGSSWQQWEKNQVLRISGKALSVCIQECVNNFLERFSVRLHYCVWWVGPNQPLAHSLNPSGTGETSGREKVRKDLWVEIKTV